MDMDNSYIKVACIGDSITAGFGLEDWDDSYPNQLHYLLGDNYVVNPNLGKSGSSIWRHSLLPYIKTQEFINAVHWPGDILVVCLGTNDTVYQATEQFCREFKADYEDLLSFLLTTSPTATAYLCKIPPIFRVENAQFAENVTLINTLIAKVAESNGLPLIDLNTPLASSPDLLPDGLHPNEEGARIIARTVCDAIK